MIIKHSSVSIIIPLYYGSKYLKSLLAMFENNIKKLQEEDIYVSLEVIIVNDAPDEHIEELKGSIVINNERNIGVHASRIRGLLNAKGTYVLFLDQDDEIADDYLYSQLVNIHNADAVVCNGYYRGNKLIAEKMPDIDQNYYVLWRLVRSPGQVLIKKDSIPQEWIDNIVQVSGADDMFLWILMSIKGRKFRTNSETVFFHIENGKNTSFNWEQQKKSLEEVNSYLKCLEILPSQMYVKWSQKIQYSINKFEKYSNLEKQWNQICKRELSIGAYIKNSKIETVAIYGYGVIGKRLLNDLVENRICVEYMVDKDGTLFPNDNIIVYRPEDRLPYVDMLIITPIFAFDEIKQQINDKNFGQVVSLETLLDVLLKKEYISAE